MSNEPITVRIEAEKRRKIILAALIGVVPPELQDLSEDKLAVSDNDIKWFIQTMTPSEKLATSQKYRQTFLANANAAIARLEAENPTYTPMRVSRISADMFDLNENVSK